MQTEKRSLSTLCALLGYTRQAYYKSLKHSESEHFQAELIIQQVLSLRVDQRKLGCRKLHLLLEGFLREQGISIGRDAMFDLLREHRLLVRRRSRKPITTFSKHWLRKYPNLITGLTPTRPCEIWVSDITYIKINGGFAYLSLITDAYSRLIVGYHLSKDLSANGCVQALQMAFSSNQVSSLIHHSDRGIQYCSYEYTSMLIRKEVRISMAQKGDPLENAIAERVNGILKTELLRDRYSNFEVAMYDIDNAIKVYNTKRPHSSIDMLTPAVAHLSCGTLKRRWKAYYKPNKGKEVNLM